MIDGKEIAFKATAAIPRLYRIKFNRDILKDIAQLSSAYSKAVTESEQLSVIDLEIFENAAYIMAKHASPETVPNNIADWLDNFKTFSIFEVLPEILMLWAENEETQVESKKKLSQVVGK